MLDAIWPAALAGLLLALLLVPGSRRVALAAKVVDRPGRRKLQGEAVPLLGGAAVLLAVAGGSWAGVWWNGAPVPAGTLPAVLGALCVFLVGLIDDLRKHRGGLSARSKFGLQLVAVLLLCSGRISALSDGTGGTGGTGEWLALFVLLLVLLSVINAANVVDNMNGLSAGLVLISAAALLLFGNGFLDAGHRLALAALAGALLGFLPFNFPRARSYLGDAGSYLIGYLIGLFALQLTTGFLDLPARPIRLAGALPALLPALLLVGLPLFDLTFVVVRRLLERRPICSGDARHLSHRLVGAGLSPVQAVSLLLFLQLMMVAAGGSILLAGAGAKAAVTAAVALLFSIGAAWLVAFERRGRGLP